MLVWIHRCCSAPEQAAGAHVCATLTIHKERQTLAMYFAADADTRGPRGPNQCMHTYVSRKHAHEHWSSTSDVQTAFIAWTHAARGCDPPETPATFACSWPSSPVCPGSCLRVPGWLLRPAPSAPGGRCALVCQSAPEALEGHAGVRGTGGAICMGARSPTRFSMYYSALLPGSVCCNNEDGEVGSPTAATHPPHANTWGVCRLPTLVAGTHAYVAMPAVPAVPARVAVCVQRG